MSAKAERSELEQFFAKGKRRSFKRKEVIIYGQDDPGVSGYWIIEGYVKAVTYSKSGNERNLYIFGPGELFSTTVLFDARVKDLSFIAASDVKVYQRSKEDFKEFIEKNPQELRYVVDVLIHAIERLYCMYLDTARERVAYMLLNLAERFGVKDGNQTMIDLPLSQQDFADIVRLSRESVGKILGRLEEQKAVIVGRKYISVYNDRVRAQVETLD